MFAVFLLRVVEVVTITELGLGRFAMVDIVLTALRGDSETGFGRLASVDTRGARVVDVGDGIIDNLLIGLVVADFSSTFLAEAGIVPAPILFILARLVTVPLTSTGLVSEIGLDRVPFFIAASLAASSSCLFCRSSR